MLPGDRAWGMCVGTERSNAPPVFGSSAEIKTVLTAWNVHVGTDGPNALIFFRKPRRDQDGVDKQMETRMERRRQAKKTMGGSTAGWLLEKATLA